jgi:CBS-domain-containing membrane protein
LDLARYLDYLRTSPYFRNIVFLDQQGRFEGLMDPEALRLLLEYTEGRKTIEESLEEWNLSAIPGMIRSSVPETARNREALQRMLVESINVLPVVDSNRAFLGVVTRDEIVSRSIYSMIAND